jgi:hypothetical protein
LQLLTVAAAAISTTTTLVATAIWRTASTPPSVSPSSGGICRSNIHIFLF